MSHLTETELHAYVDGQLDDARRVQVEAHLAHDPVATESVRVWREQNEALRALYNPVLNEPVPQRLLAAARARRAAVAVPARSGPGCKARAAPRSARARRARSRSP